MKFLIKDLSRMTSFSPARIRKWQERYRIFKPLQGENGYWYYSNEDYLVLRSIQQRLAMGQKLSQVMLLGREHLLAHLISDDFSERDWRIIQSAKDGDYPRLEKELGRKLQKQKFPQWLKAEIQPMLVVIGRAWEAGYLSISEEHAFSHWLHAYLMQLAAEFPTEGERNWLVAVYPGDQHELGAILHYCLLRYRAHNVRFVGMLPREELLRELRDGDYRRVSVSVVMPQPQTALSAFRADIKRVQPAVRIYFGGIALRKRGPSSKIFPEDNRRDAERLAELEGASGSGKKQTGAGLNNVDTVEAGAR